MFPFGVLALHEDLSLNSTFERTLTLLLLLALNSKSSRTPRTVTRSVLGNLYGFMLSMLIVTSEGFLLFLTAQLYIKNKSVFLM